MVIVILSLCRYKDKYEYLAVLDMDEVLVPHAKNMSLILVSELHLLLRSFTE